MPPKVDEPVSEPTTVFVFEKDRMFKKFNEENYVTRAKIQPIDVLHRKPKDPSEKLKERLNTYHNVHKMKTDYKNYVRWYGVPSFDVPNEITSTV